MLKRRKNRYHTTMKQDDEITINPSQLAEKFERQIKKVVMQNNASITEGDLQLLTDKEDGVYISKEDPGTLCCLVLEKKEGVLYLVTADMTEKKTNLENFLAKKVA